MEEINNNITQGSYTNKPFPLIIINNFLPKDIYNNIDKEWPNEDIFKNKDVYIQSKKNTKQIIVTNSSTWTKAMNKSPALTQLYDILSNIETFKTICQVFKDDLNTHLNVDITNITPKVDFFICTCSSVYICNIHTDRRDHIFSLLIYCDIINNNDSRLNVHELINKDVEVYDVFPSQDDVILSKSIKSSQNNAIIMFNTPYSYHSVKPFKTIDKTYKRRYLSVTYDFDSKNVDVVEKNKGCLDSNIWKKKIKSIFTKKKKSILRY